MPPFHIRKQKQKKKKQKKAREGVEKNQVVERSQEEIDQETKVSKFTQIHTELLKAICAYDNHKQALHLLKEHLDCGVACKTVIPSVSMSLACVSPNDAYEVLDEILGRKDTKVFYQIFIFLKKK